MASEPKTGSVPIDDLPPPSWPDGHAAKVPVLVADLQQRRGCVWTQFAWASGLMMLVRTPGGRA
jgi:hypothetical protein